MKNENLIKAITSKQTSDLLPIMKAAYQLDPMPKHELGALAKQTNDKLGYKLFDDYHYPRLVRDVSMVTRAMQHNAIKPIDSDIDLKTQLEAQMRHAIAIQNEKYDNIVLPALGDDALYPEAYKRYVKELNGFDAQAFRNVVNKLTELKESDPQELANWSSRFEYVAKYAYELDAYNKQATEMYELDATPDEYGDLIRPYDIARTNAHNGLIDLFNKLNEFAWRNNMSKPYPEQQYFDKSNPMDRAHVAEVLLQQEPLLESTHLFLLSERTMMSDTERYKQMTFAEQLEVARKYNDAKELEEGVKELYENELER